MLLGHAGAVLQVFWCRGHPCRLHRRPGGGTDIPKPREPCGGGRGHLRPVQDGLPQHPGCFFQMHEPTTLNRQGHDIGVTFRSAIFYPGRGAATHRRAVITDSERVRMMARKLVTEVVPSGTFWKAEPEYQNYLQRHPDAYMSQYVRKDWKLPRTPT